MKLVPAKIDRFLRAPDPAVTGVLVYGPDRGLVRERADQLTQAVAGTLSDPFRIADLSAEAISGDAARLHDEAASLPFSGGRKVVRVRDGKDGMAEAVRSALDSPTVAGLLIVEAADLPPRSALRQVFETARNAAAVPCYADEGTTLRQVIEADLSNRSVSIGEDALDLLASLLGVDRAVTRGEVEKLACYVGAGSRASVDDVLAVIGDAHEFSLDSLAFAACAGDYVSLERGLRRVAASGGLGISLLRAVSRHLQRLLQVQAAVARGQPVKVGIEALKPAVFFKLRPAFEAQVRRWPAQALAGALLLITETELECKRAGAPQQLLCRSAVLTIARLAVAQRRRALHP